MLGHVCENDEALLCLSKKIYKPEKHGRYFRKTLHIFFPISKGGLGSESSTLIRLDFFSATVNGLTYYIIRHHFLKWKYDIIAMPPFINKMHRSCKPTFWVPCQVLGRLGGTRIHMIASDKMLSDQDQYRIIDLVYYIGDQPLWPCILAIDMSQCIF